MVVLLLMLTIMLYPSMQVSAKKSSLSKEQKKIASTIYKECKKNWKKYGVLPSVCIGQGIVESGLGKSCRSNNLWGICSGRISYKSLKSGIHGYMKTINNGYYKKAPGQKSYKKQTRAIANGGYCGGSHEHYYQTVINTIKKYGLSSYDKKMFKEIKKEKKLKKLKKKQKALKKKMKLSNSESTEQILSE